MNISVLPLLCVSALSTRVWAAPVGMAAQVKGQVSVVQKDATAPLRLLGRVEDGATVSCGPNSSAIIVMFGSGERFQLGAGARVRITPTGVRGAQKMAAFSGPSAKAVKLLGNARVGSIMARQGNSQHPLEGNASGIINGSKSRFAWKPITGATRYTFTLFDGADVVWSASSAQTEVSYAANGPSLVEKRPYVWKLSAFGTTGKAIQSLWGVVTPLSEENARALEVIATDLQTQAQTTPNDNTPLLLLVETFREYGVLHRALNLLDQVELTEPGAADAKSDLIALLGPIARVMSGRGVPPANNNLGLDTLTP